jgi:hypothetical protein
METNYARAFAAAGRSDVLEAWASLRELEPESREVLVVGRPIAEE